MSPLISVMLTIESLVLCGVIFPGLAAIMGTRMPPSKNDPLIPAWAAYEHHQLKQPSRLVMLDDSHFFPVAKNSEDFRIATGEMKSFLAQADEGKAAEGFRNETSRKDFKALWDGGPSVRGPKNWWVVLAIGMLFGALIPRTGAVLGGLAGGLLVVDLVAGLGTVAIGAMIRKGESTRLRRLALVAVWGFVASIPAAILLRIL